MYEIIMKIPKSWIVFHAYFAVKYVVPRQFLVDSVWPLYGPVAGVTRVTITGQSLSVFTVTAVYFGQHQGFIDKHR